jgi:hypothetical protein
MVRNVHERRIAASPEAVGQLIDTLAGDADLLWPANWPAMRFDRPLGVGAEGGHGPIRYSVEAYDPGRRVVFRFAPGSGLDGIHYFVALPADGGAALLRHVLEGTTYGSTRLLWPLAIRPMHDACAEDCLDQAERALGVGPAAPARWSPWVRLLFRLEARGAVRSAAVPADVIEMSGLPQPDHSDAVVATIPAGARTDVDGWYDTVFSAAAMPGWLGTLFRIRGSWRGRSGCGRRSSPLAAACSRRGTARRHGRRR